MFQCYPNIIIIVVVRHMKTLCTVSSQSRSDGPKYVFQIDPLTRRYVDLFFQNEKKNYCEDQIVIGEFLIRHD